MPAILLAVLLPPLITEAGATLREHLKQRRKLQAAAQAASREAEMAKLRERLTALEQRLEAEQRWR